MVAIREFCPRCQSLRDVGVTSSEREEIDSEGNLRKIVTKTYHCANCHTTLRSEEIEPSRE